MVAYIAWQNMTVRYHDYWFTSGAIN